VHQEDLDHQDLKELQDHWVLQDLLAQKVLKDNREAQDLLVTPDQEDHQGLWVHQDLAVYLDHLDQ
jgi:phage pi2 protein 07